MKLRWMAGKIAMRRWLTFRIAVLVACALLSLGGCRGSSTEGSYGPPPVRSYYLYVEGVSMQSTFHAGDALRFTLAALVPESAAEQAQHRRVCVAHDEIAGSGEDGRYRISLTLEKTYSETRLVWPDVPYAMVEYEFPDSFFSLSWGVEAKLNSLAAGTYELWFVTPNEPDEWFSCPPPKKLFATFSVLPAGEESAGQ